MTSQEKHRICPVCNKEITDALGKCKWCANEKISDFVAGNANPFISFEKDRTESAKLFELETLTTDNDGRMRVATLIELKAIRWELTALRRLYGKAAFSSYANLAKIYQQVGLINDFPSSSD